MLAQDCLHTSVPAGSSVKGEARAHFRLAHYADSQYRTLQLQHKTRERAEELAGLKHRKQQVQTQRCPLRPVDLITARGRRPAGPRCLSPGTLVLQVFIDIFQVFINTWFCQETDFMDSDRMTLSCEWFR